MDNRIPLIITFIVLIIVAAVLLAINFDSDEPTPSLTLVRGETVNGVSNFYISDEYPKVLGTINQSEIGNHLLTTMKITAPYRELTNLIGNVDTVHFMGLKTDETHYSTDSSHLLTLSENKIVLLK